MAQLPGGAALGADKEMQRNPCGSGLSDEQRRIVAALYEANYRSVLALCRRLLSDAEDAADAAQEVFLKAVTSMPPEASSEIAGAWLRVAARNHCIDLLRRRRRQGTALATMMRGTTAPLEPDRTVEDRHFVRQVLEELRPRERTALWQAAVESRPVAEIAGYLGMTYMAAGQLVHRARKHAALAAAKLATIFGVSQLNRPGNRPSLGVLSSQAAALIVVPVLLAAGTVASTATPATKQPTARPHTIAATTLGSQPTGPGLASPGNPSWLATDAGVPGEPTGINPFRLSGLPAANPVPVPAAVSSVIGVPGSILGPVHRSTPLPLPTPPIPHSGLGLHQI